MLVKTIEHGRAVFERLYKKTQPVLRWLVIDTETEAKKGYPKDDALVIQRQNIKIWSVCYMGESYSFPTNKLGPEFPTMAEWVDLLRPYAQRQGYIKAFHNANYDINVFKTAGLFGWKSIYCTMIGAWKANAQHSKGLKERAPLYGRFLRKTSSVDFDNLEDIALYAEEDVIQTDEIFQMQMFGKVKRPGKIFRLCANGKLAFEKQHLPFDEVLVIPNEDLNKREKRELEFQELPYLYATLRAEWRGMPYDVERHGKLQVELKDKTEIVLKRILRAAGKTINLNSTVQLGNLFNDLGIVSPKKTKKGKQSWNVAALAMLEDSHPIVKDLRQYRSLTTMTNYIGVVGGKDKDRGYAHYVNSDGCIHSTSNTVGAVTGRTSASNPNLTQVPSAKDIFGVKGNFTGPKGHVVIVLDYKQLELRVGTMYHQDPSMMTELRDPEGDLHQLTADEFGVDRDPTSKNINFLFQFGGGAYVLSELLTFHGTPTTKQVAATFEDRYNEVYYKVKPWRQDLIQEHMKNGQIRLLTNRTRSLLNYPWEQKAAWHKAETTLANNSVQGAGQDFLKAAIIRADPLCINPDRAVLRSMTLKREHKLLITEYANRVDKLRKFLAGSETVWRLQVHDESIWTTRRDHAEEALHVCAELMCMRHYFPTRKPYCVPIVVDGGVGETWKDGKSKSATHRIVYGFENGYDEI